MLIYSINTVYNNNSIISPTLSTNFISAVYITFAIRTVTFTAKMCIFRVNSNKFIFTYFFSCTLWVNREAD